LGHLHDITTNVSKQEISAFSRAALTLLRQIEYRPIQSGEDIEQLYAFRYNCYVRDGWIKENPQKLSYDAHDDEPNIMRFGLFINDKMVSSIRLQHVTADRRVGPSVVIFPDIIDPMLEAGKTMIDPSRLTIDADASKEYPMLPYLTVRLAAMVSQHYGVDYCLSSIRPSHGAFYKRLIESKMIAGERYYKGIAFPVHLYASHVPESLGRVFTKYPFFKSLPVERKMLFGTPELGNRSALTVLPTADFAIAA